MGGNRKAMQGQIDPIKSREHIERYLKLCYKVTVFASTATAR